MADIFSKKKRSDIMSKVRSKDSKIEVEFRKALWNAGFRYRKNSTKYFGKIKLNEIRKGIRKLIDIIKK